MFIKDVKPFIIKNSRKEKTIQIDIETYEGKFSASAPSGKSKGKHEVLDYDSKGIEHSMILLRALASQLKFRNFIIKNFYDLKEVESFIRIFEQKHGRIGGNGIYALELAILKAAAKEKKKELWEFIKGDRDVKMPVPIGNCIGGGQHSSEKSLQDKYLPGNIPDFQEFLLIPKEETFSKNITKMIHAYDNAGRLIKKKERKFRLKRNDEGAWETDLSNEEVLDILHEIGEKFDIRTGIDVAASTFYKNGYYDYKNKKLIRDRIEQMDYIERLIGRYKLFYVEDPLQEEDFAGFIELNEDVKNRALIVGDDLTVTNMDRTMRAVRAKAINSIIIKPNQIGSLIETAKVIKFCKENNIKIIFSHRSGETMDSALADLAVGFQADFLKAGIFGKERLVKLARVMKIEKNVLSRK